MVWIPPNVDKRQELFRRFQVQLAFPNYFGWNWDALYDLLCDFSWIHEKYITIIHSDLPMQLEKEDARTYLEILRDAVGSWKTSKEHELVVLFPMGLYGRIRTLLQK
jgi:RNAse (barnase) inhibitor barstar